MGDKKSSRGKEHPDYKAMHEGRDGKESSTAAAKLSVSEKLATSPHSETKSSGKSSHAPVEGLPEAAERDVREREIDEKKELLARLARLDEQQKRLQERKELDILRKQVEEREQFVSELEKSVSTSVSTKPKVSKDESKSVSSSSGDKTGEEVKVRPSKSGKKSRTSSRVHAGSAKEPKSTGTTEEVLPVIVYTNGTQDAVTNVALHKETLQSHLTQYSSSIVVDGSRDQYVANGSCVNIEKKGNSWWQVDLGDIYTIFHVRVFLAKDCCDIVVEDCYDRIPLAYRGKTNTTVSGKTCRRWDSVYPYNLLYRYAMNENYCRAHPNLTEQHGEIFWERADTDLTWCHTTDQNVTWEHCEVEKCEEVATDDLIPKIGTRVKTLEIPEYKVVIDHPRHIREYILTSNSRVRYVEFHQDGTVDYYPLCEVEVFGVHDVATNVALQKTAEMSTIDPKTLYGPNRAIDGLLYLHMSQGSCFHTAEEDNPWWRVDLDGDRTHDVQLTIGTSLDTMLNAGFVEGRINIIQNMILPNNTEARFVELKQNGWGAFHLCEVEVFGRIAECKYDPCQNGGNCFAIHCDDSDNCRNYTCACANGFGGVDCEVCTYNVAFGKQIEASSIHYKNWLPSNAIDGDTNQNVMFGATCVSTQEEIRPYLVLDLGDEYNLTSVNVYKRSDSEDDYAVELFLLISTWTSYGGRIERISKFEIYPYVATRKVKLMAKEEYPVFLQLCEIEVFGICQEDFTATTSSPQTTSSHQTTVEPPMPIIQMRFSLSDNYGDVVKSKASFIDIIRQGLSNQTGYQVDSFQNIQVEKVPFRVSMQLHAIEGDRAMLNKMLKKIYTLVRFGILEIEKEDGHLLAITAGSLQYHMLYLGNKGTRIDSPFLVAVSIIVIALSRM